MLSYLIRRLLFSIPVLLGVTFAVMLTIELIPGDPVSLMLGEHATPEAVAQVRHALGLDQPLLVRSLCERRPVTQELADVWPTTLELTLAALCVAVIFGILAGVISAVWPNSFFDGVTRLASLFGLSMPVFWTGLVLIAFFSLWLQWLPVGGSGSLSHPILPATTLALPSLAMVARLTRSSVLEVLREDYIRTARAMGTPTWAILARHLLPNFLPTLIVYSTLYMANAILVEAALSFLGLGVQPPTASWGLMVATGRDFLLMAPHIATIPGLAIMFAVLGYYLLGDGLRDALDPRLRT